MNRKELNKPIFQLFTHLEGIVIAPTILSLVESEIIKNLTLKKPKINKLELQTGDVKKTHGSNKEITKLTNFKPRTSIKEGIKNSKNLTRT